ncbi:MAG: hypothetical protein K9J12_10485 [Melioribacteraceae bacterium]|nr:hypothetical protein [Melioribacteraceae bacterium]MCF8264755.1 hypothetical protein [Melioribacteraceae bacterium]
MKERIIKITIIIIFLCGYALSAQTNFSDDLRCGTDIFIRDAVFEEDVDLTEICEFTDFTTSQKLCEINSNIIFDNCTFQNFTAFRSGDTLKYIIQFNKNLIFSNCYFNGNLNLADTKIVGEFSLKSSTIAKSLNLSGAWILGKISDFSGMRCFGITKISNSIFENRVNFLNAVFDDMVIFQHSVFKGKAIMGAVNFNDSVVFSNALFFQNLLLSKSEFHKKSFFNYLDVRGSAEFNDTEFKLDPEFNHARFLGLAIFNGSNINSNSLNESAFFLTKPVLEK